MPEEQIEAIGGWLKHEDHYLNRTDRRLDSIDLAIRNPDHIAYFEDYRRRYFNDRLLPGQHVEEILATPKDHVGMPCRCIDLGADATTLFWSIAVDQPGSVAICDLGPEALYVLAAFKASSESPQSYRDALALAGKTENKFNQTRSLPWTSMS